MTSYRVKEKTVKDNKLFVPLCKATTEVWAVRTLRFIPRSNRIHSACYFNLKKNSGRVSTVWSSMLCLEKIWVSSRWHRLHYHVTASRILRIKRLFTNQYLLLEVFVWLLEFSSATQVSNGSTTTSHCFTKTSYKTVLSQRLSWICLWTCCCITLILRRSHTGTVWFYTSNSNKRAARPKLYTKSLTRDLKRMYSRLTLVRISINL